MNRFLQTGLILATLTALIAYAVWARPAAIRHYSAEDLIGLTCQELGQKHEDLIFAYHDAELAHRRKTGAFHDDLGLPSEDVLPYVVLMRQFMQDNAIPETAVVKSTSVSSPMLDSDFSYEISEICAANPELPALDAMRQAAVKFKLVAEAAKP